MPAAQEDGGHHLFRGALAFKPKLSLALKGGTKRNDHPALHSVLTYRKGGGYSNIGKALVTLPGTEFIDNAHIQSPCTRVQFNANQCPKGSILGKPGLLATSANLCAKQRRAKTKRTDRQDQGARSKGKKR